MGCAGGPVERDSVSDDVLIFRAINSLPKRRRSGAYLQCVVQSTKNVGGEEKARTKKSEVDRAGGQLRVLYNGSGLRYSVEGPLSEYRVQYYKIRQNGNTAQDNKARAPRRNINAVYGRYSTFLHVDREAGSYATSV